MIAYSELESYLFESGSYLWIEPFADIYRIISLIKNEIWGNFSNTSHCSVLARKLQTFKRYLTAFDLITFICSHWDI